MAIPSRITQEMIDHYQKEGYWDTTTFAQIWDRNAIQYGDRVALVDGRHRLTWADCKQWIDRMALGFLERGMKRDDVMVAQLPNYVEMNLARVACEKAGLIFIQALRNLRHREMEYIIKYTDTVGIIMPWKFGNFDHFQMIQDLMPNIPTLKHIFVVGDEIPPGTVSIGEMVREPLEERYPPDHLERTACPPLEFCLIGQTTGTTGFPKFVEWPIASRMFQARTFAGALRLTDKDVLAIVSPGGAGASSMAYLGAPLVGAKVVMLDRFDAEAALRQVQEEGVTIGALVPSQLQMMVRHPDFEKYDMSSLRVVVSTGAALAYQDGVEAEEKLGVPIVQAYGSTDSGNGGFGNMDDEREERLLTVGKCVPGIELKLVDEDGNEVPQGEVGEAWLRSAASGSGYFRDPETTRESWTEDGWFKMGDLGRINRHGNLVLVGRKKDLIIRGGQNIFPAEVENLIMSHPNVSQASIVGMPDPLMGEKCCAYVVPMPGKTIAFDEMVAFLQKTDLASYKLPERLEIVDELPTVAEGQKVDKKALLRDIEAKLKSEGA
ncbi:MAG: AMP-binding protein [Dehalococcoidia bacterium]